MKALLPSVLLVFGLASRPVAAPARGADISWFPRMDSAKVVFRDRSGTPGPLLPILSGLGVDAIRLRVWVNPADGHSGKAEVVRLARTVTSRGFRLMVDFHYSDSWADPGTQVKPAAWAGHGLAQLQTDVADHTRDVLGTLRDSGVAPEWVQIGNETNDGMLWPEGRATLDMAGFASLVKSGSKVVREVFPAAKVVVHLSNAYDNVMYRWMFDGMKTHGVDYDAIGMSLYPETSTWRSTAEQARANMLDMVSRHGKAVVVSEIGLDRTDEDSAYALLRTVLADVAALPDGKGLGVFYWEPEAFELWGGYQKSAFDNTGRPTLALTAFQGGQPSSAQPARRFRVVPARPHHDALGRAQEPSETGRNLEILLRGGSFSP